MEILMASIVLILLVVVSNIISHYVVFLPTALIEIGIGLLFVLLFNIHISLQADWFMLLFVAPLLFNDGKHFPKDELWELRAPIFANAIILVFLTTIVGGYFVSWLVPEIPLPLAMALIAVLSPTDPVAVHGIAEQIKLPKKILSLISGESLINDASGLIAFRYALAAFMTGYFSFTQAASNFLYMSLVGGIIGFLFIYFIHFIRMFLVQQGIHDVILHTTIHLLTPFIIFIVADELAHASGVIAVVTAGVLSINQEPIFRSQYSEVRLVTTKLWDILVYLLNGIVFVVLGAQLPTAMSETLQNPSISNWLLIFYIIAIWLMLLLVRVVWTYVNLWITYLKTEPDNRKKPLLNTALLTGITGVRGAVTMASIMSMPFFLDTGDYFQERSLLIFLACGVVLTSLVVATVTLPVLTKQRKRLMLVTDEPSDDLEAMKEKEPNHPLTEIEARKVMVQTALQSLKEEASEDIHPMILTDLIHEFETRLRYLYREDNDPSTNSKYSSIEKQVQQIAIQGELLGIKELEETKEISHSLAKNYQKNIRSRSHIRTFTLKNTFRRSLYNMQRQLNRSILRYNASKMNKAEAIGESALIKLEIASTKGAIHALRNHRQTLEENAHVDPLEQHITNQLLHEYLYKLQRIKHLSSFTRQEYQNLLQKYYMRALDTERETVQDLYQHGQISMGTANKLRQSINYYETSLFQ